MTSPADRPGGAAVPRTVGQLVRFALVGGSNTLVTFALFVLLQRWLPPGVAYTVVFALGLAYTTAMTSRVVFGSRPTWRRSALFAGWYLAVYGVGLAVVGALHAVAQPSAVVTALVTVAVTAPLTFVGGRVLFGGPVPAAAPPVRDRAEPGTAVRGSGPSGRW
ncbi:GtrA family protein [Klenkia sp. PcliD-1-E]|uniref:GtrA family protein n=1 Tax=Klenkia sp. PcliD-1-E TaxID=2954492 RepID=UPI0020975DFC|nr:GtrA family protein [Klenkia sp. PcliD-1-E]MCO7218759.1 GtrA family protein [Klenkia sp. PcliD-1-E]